MSGKQAIYDWVGGGIQRCKTLYESGESNSCLRFRYVTIYLEQVEYDVRAPAQDKDCKTKQFINNLNKNVFRKNNAI